MFSFAFYIWIFFFLLLCSTLSSSSLSNRHKSSHRRCSIEKAVLKKFETFSGKRLCWSHFLIKLHVWGPATLLKRESNKGVFLWILGHFKEDLLWRTSANDSFCRQFYMSNTGSYKPCTHPHPPTLTHTRPHPPTSSQKKVTLTHTHPHQPKKGLTHPHPPKKMSQSSTPTHT